MFGLNFNDVRYFDMNTVSDTIIRLNYTAHAGGDLLRRATNQAAQRHLPGDGWCFFDLRHEFPDARPLFRDSSKDRRSVRRLSLRLDRKMFPFVPGGREIWISKMAILFATREQDDCGCLEIEGCPCPEPGRPASRIVEFTRGRDERDDDRDCDGLQPEIARLCGVFCTSVVRSAP